MARNLHCLRSTRVRGLKGQKEKGEGEKDLSEGQEGKSLTLLGKGGPADFLWGPGPHQGVTSTRGYLFLKECRSLSIEGKSQEIPGASGVSPRPAEIPCEGLPVWGNLLGWRPAHSGERIHPRQSKGDRDVY